MQMNVTYPFYVVASCIGDRSCNQDAAFGGVYNVGPSACVGIDSCSMNSEDIGSSKCAQLFNV
jgi:hypothetical protein